MKMVIGKPVNFKEFPIQTSTDVGMQFRECTNFLSCVY